MTENLEEMMAITRRRLEYLKSKEFPTFRDEQDMESLEKDMQRFQEELSNDKKRSR